MRPTLPPPQELAWRRVFYKGAKANKQFDFCFCFSFRPLTPLLSASSKLRELMKNNNSNNNKNTQAQIFLASTESIGSKEVIMKTSFVSSLLIKPLNQKLSMRRYPGKSSTIHLFPLGRITKKLFFVTGY